MPLTGAFVTPGISRVLRVFQSPGGEYMRETIWCVGLLADHEQVFVPARCPAATVSPSAALTSAGVTWAHALLGTCAPAARRPDATSTDATTRTETERAVTAVCFEPRIMCPSMIEPARPRNHERASYACKRVRGVSHLARARTQLDFVAAFLAGRSSEER